VIFLPPVLEGTKYVIRMPKEPYMEWEMRGWVDSKEDEAQLPLEGNL